MGANSPEYQARYFKAWYQSNKKSQLKAVYRRKARLLKENRDLYWAYLQEHPCKDCGNTDPVVLDADHVRGRKKNHISRMLSFCSWTTILKELAKCDIRCANCHRTQTSQRGKHWRTGYKH